MTTYRQSITIESPADRVYDALTTIDGLRGWWTSLAAGNPTTGDIHFGFAGLDEHITMHVDTAIAHQRVAWTCTEHTGHPEWVDTRIEFGLESATPQRTILRLSHVGLVPELSCYEACDRGWQHFLPSISAYCTRGHGHPFDDR